MIRKVADLPLLCPESLNPSAVIEAFLMLSNPTYDVIESLSWLETDVMESCALFSMRNISDSTAYYTDVKHWMESGAFG